MVRYTVLTYAACLLLGLAWHDARAGQPTSLAEALERARDDNWVDLERDIMFIGEVVDVDSHFLSYVPEVAGIGKQSANRHAGLKFEVCRWIVGSPRDSVTVHYPGLVYRDASGEVLTQLVGGESFPAIGTLIVAIATESKYQFGGSSEAEYIYSLRSVRYLFGDCMDDDQLLYEMTSIHVDRDRASGKHSAYELAACVRIASAPSSTSLRDLIASVLNNSQE